MADEGLLKEALRGIVRNSDDYIFVKDVDLVYRAASDTVATMAGLTSGEELIGRTDFDIFPDDLARKYREDDRRVMEEGTSILGMVEPLPERDGIKRWTKTWKHVLRDGSGTVQGLYGISRDITEVVTLEAEASLSEGRRMYQAAARLAGICVWEYDIPGHRLLAGEDGLSLLGLPDVVEGVPDSLYPLYDEKNAAIVAKMHAAIDAGEHEVRAEFWTKRTASSEPRCSRVLYNVVDDEDGRPVKAFGVGQDVTTLKLEEESYERTLRQMLAASPLTLCSFKLDLTANTCEGGHSNAPYIQQLLLASTVDRLFENIASLIVDPAEKIDFRRRFSRKSLLEEFNNGHSDVADTYRRRTEDGDAHWVTTTVNMVQNPHTGDVEAVASSVDSDETVLDEHIMQSMTNSGYDYVGIIRPDSRTFQFRNVNPTYEGYPLHRQLSYDECIDYAIGHHVYDDDVTAYRSNTDPKFLIEQLEGSEGYVFTYRCVEEGKVRQKSIRYCYLDRKKKGDILVVQTDITIAYEMEQAQMERLQDALDEAERANRAKSDFLSRMSHDIRTPMNGIIGMTHIARGTDDLAKKDECLGKIDTSSRFLLGLINDILDLSKVESGSVALHTEPYHSEDFLGYIDAVIRPLCEQKGIQFEVKANVVSDELPIMDELRTNQIAFNLLSNAVKFTPEGGRVIFTLDESMVDPSHMDMTATVSDTGIGMSREFIETHLYEPFSQEGSANAKTQGTGLGLAIVKRMADLMGGTIEVRSAKGEGTTFTLHGVLECVPLASVTPKADEPFDGCAVDLEGRKVLLVEDHPLNAEIAVALLEDRGIKVDVAEDGKQAVDLFRGAPMDFFDAVLMDVRMPVMDGYEAARAIRALDRPDAKRIPIIAMTADAYVDDIRKAKAAGMDDHIAKPVDPAVLYRVLASHMGLSGTSAGQK